MPKLHYYLFLFIIPFSSCLNQDKMPIRQTLHENWQFRILGDSTWSQTTIPGNNYSDLLALGKIPDPFIGTNEEKVQWVATKDWEYQRVFELPDSILSKDHIALSFEGLDTYAQLFLNDSLIGHTNNAFRVWDFEIKPMLQKQNTLRIVFDATSKHESHAAAQLDYTLPAGPRVFTRKAQFQYGWDWGPILNTSGIWKPLTIHAWSDAIINDFHIKQDSLNQSRAKLTAEVNITSDLEGEAELSITYDKEEISSTIKLKKGTNLYEIPFTINQPKLWWTYNLGEPYLYTFEVKLKEGSTSLDLKRQKRGLRTIELVTEKDARGESFYFKLNGEPVFMKGANYIPQNSFQNKVNAIHYNQLLNDVVAANMNMLRVWGGGIYEQDQFYERCDEKGILIWQDFMFACAMYPSDDAFLQNVQQEAIDQVKRLRNHASIALWCGNNENSEAWHNWGWQAGKTEAQKEEIWNGYLAVFDSILPNTVSQLHPEIPYWESSPKYGRGNPKFELEGDAHDWWVWHDATPFEHFEEHVPRFMSEFGFQSFPSYEAIRLFTQQDSIDIEHESYDSHQKHPRGFKLIREYMSRDYPVPTQGDDYVYVSQLVQARGMTKGIEAQRRAMPYCMGSLYWQLNDCWPVVSWSGIDFLGNWKALHHQAKYSFEDILISSILKKDTVHTYLISDKLSPQSGTLNISVLDFNGVVLDTFSKAMIIPKTSSVLAYQLPKHKIKGKAEAVVLKMEFNEATSLFYLVRPKDLKLPTAPISQTISKVPTGFEIKLSASTLQKDVFLHCKAKGKFSDNFFDLLPNETKIINFQTETKTLDDLGIKTLNQL